MLIKIFYRKKIIKMAKILVTDGGYSHALAIIRSLTLKGHIVDCIGQNFAYLLFQKV